MDERIEYKIYEIVCNETGEVYYGKTIQTLEKRLLQHKDLSCSSRKIIERDNYYIKQIDSTFDEKESIKLERYYIETFECVNENIPGRINNINIECNFCKSVLKTSSSLNYHKKNNKKCLDVQKNISNNNINSILKICSFCNIQFTNIKKHLKTCKVKKNQDVENLISSNNELQLKLESDNNKLKLDNKHLELVNELLNNEKNDLLNEKNNLLNEKNDLLNDINKSKNEINYMKEYIIKLETENNIYSKDHETITTIAKQNNNYKGFLNI